jgi:hypothetical protein
MAVKVSIVVLWLVKPCGLECGQDHTASQPRGVGCNEDASPSVCLVMSLVLRVCAKVVQPLLGRFILVE